MKKGLQEFIGHFKGHFGGGREHAGVPRQRKEHLFGDGLIGLFCLEAKIGQLEFYRS
jgi:hypothetical protein